MRPTPNLSRQIIVLDEETSSSDSEDWATADPYLVSDYGLPGALPSLPIMLHRAPLFDPYLESESWATDDPYLVYRSLFIIDLR